MLKSSKVKIILILFVAALMVSTVLMFYPSKDTEWKTRLAQDLWRDIQNSELQVQKNIPYSKDFPAGFRDASMGKAMTGPIKVEGG